MKRLCSLLLTLCMLLLLYACGQSSKIESAASMMETGNYEGALAVLTALEADEEISAMIAECENAIVYNNAVAQISEGSYLKAQENFKKIPNYKDAADYLERYQTIEITPENWEMYFTIIPQPNWNENAFGEGELWGLDYCLALREEYSNSLVAANVAMEFNSKENCYVIDIDGPNFEYNITDKLLFKMHSEESTLTFTENSNIPDMIIDHCEIYPDEQKGYWYVYNSDEISLVRSKGTIELFQ